MRLGWLAQAAFVLEPSSTALGEIPLIALVRAAQPYRAASEKVTSKGDVGSCEQWAPNLCWQNGSKFNGLADTSWK
jgi:hypothetical protein